MSRLYSNKRVAVTVDHISIIVEMTAPVTFLKSMKTEINANSTKGKSE
jgi:hypothetical protein